MINCGVRRMDVCQTAAVIKYQSEGGEEGRRRGGEERKRRDGGRGGEGDGADSACRISLYFSLSFHL